MWGKKHRGGIQLEKDWRSVLRQVDKAEDARLTPGLRSWLEGRSMIKLHPVQNSLLSPPGWGCRKRNGSGSLSLRGLED